MILPEDVYSIIAKVNKIKLNLLNDSRTTVEKRLANEVVNDVLFALQELKAKL